MMTLKASYKDLEKLFGFTINEELSKQVSDIQIDKSFLSLYLNLNAKFDRVVQESFDERGE